MRMIDVGIGYLSLARKTDTLSGGEIQRIKLVRNLTGSLTNLTYIFDEPTAGLHPADAEKIANILLKLRDKHNTVLVVEHNRNMIEIADHIIELGPKAGSEGGRIIFEGSFDELSAQNTPTAQAMRQAIALNTSPKPWTDGFEIKDVHIHNLKHFDATIPRGVLTAITGVAGSGKSSLARYEFIAQYPDAIVIDQKPPGASIRSTPATYIGIMDEIRNIFAHINGVKPALFSFNSEGACPACKVRRLLQGMLEVGLEYVTLGQPTSTLSGGELQRLKLIGALNKSGNVYVLDEPSTGLHNRDVEKLSALLRLLVDKGNTVVIIEHRLELIAQADWIIDMGPDGGSEGGNVLFSGTPEQLLRCESSKTARFLNDAVKNIREVRT